jgi:hypothetical protein
VTQNSSLSPYGIQSTALVFHRRRWTLNFSDRCSSRGCLYNPTIRRVRTLNYWDLLLWFILQPWITLHRGGQSKFHSVNYTQIHDLEGVLVSSVREVVLLKFPIWKYVCVLHPIIDLEDCVLVSSVRELIIISRFAELNFQQLDTKPNLLVYRSSGTLNMKLQELYGKGSQEIALVNTFIDRRSHDHKPWRPHRMRATQELWLQGDGLKERCIR